METNAGSSIINALGVGNGVDFVQLADDLSEASFSFQRDSLQSRNEDLEARISAASVLRNALSELASATGDRVRVGDLSPRASISNPSVVNVSTTQGITPTGSYSLEVSQLADSQTLVSQSFTAATDTVGEGNLRIRFGTVDGATFTEDTNQNVLDIAVDASDTLDSLASKISSAGDGALDAYVAQGTNGAQLVIKGRDGSVNGFTLEGQSSAGSPSATPGDLSYLSWQPATDAGELRSTADDAVFELDTVEFTSASNTVTGLPDGLTFDLTATNVGDPADISFDTDNAAITDFMGDFVAALNDVVSLLNAETGIGGTLANDSGARELRRDLQRLTSEVVIPTADEGEPSTLADLGLRITRDGTFEFDAQRLSDTLAANPEATAAMFTTGAFGVFATIDSFARENTLSSDPGSLGGSVTRYEDQIERNDERLADIAEQQEALRARLARDLITAQQSVVASQSTLDFLRLQFESNDSN